MNQVEFVGEIQRKNNTRPSGSPQAEGTAMFFAEATTRRVPMSTDSKLYA
jgi:hypothetical protein